MVLSASSISQSQKKKKEKEKEKEEKGQEKGKFASSGEGALLEMHPDPEMSSFSTNS